VDVCKRREAVKLAVSVQGRAMQIKICGVTRHDDAAVALSEGANAIGCVFYPGSPRSVTVKQAREISFAVTGLGLMVGLFVNASEQQIEEALTSVPLHMLQFHGTESPAFCEQFGRPYIKAIAMSEGVDLLKENDRFHSASALLLDSPHEGQFGGSGTTFDWSRVLPEVRDRIVLAGGLSAENVAAAVAQVKPVAVDVSSGVERMKGIKDRAKIRAFINAARAAV